MNFSPEIPSLVVASDGENDFMAVFWTASAYAQSGLTLNRYAAKNQRIEFIFPAMVCTCFSIELFLKFFDIIEIADKNRSDVKIRGHVLLKLWDKIKPDHQNLIASKFKNESENPRSRAANMQSGP